MHLASASNNQISRNTTAIYIPSAHRRSYQTRAPATLNQSVSGIAPVRQPFGPTRDGFNYNTNRLRKREAKNHQFMASAQWRATRPAASVAAIHTTPGGGRIPPIDMERMMEHLLEGAVYSSESEFKPTRMALEKRGFIQPRSDNDSVSNPYKGDKNSGSFKRQINGLPDHLNCALYVKNVPVKCSMEDLFKKVTTGSVWCINVQEADEMHEMKAVKLVFMTPEGAANFLRQSRSDDGVWVRGKRLEARYNRHGYRMNETNQTRVLIIEGPTKIMKFEKWDAYFRIQCHLEWDCHLTHETVCGRTTMEFRFARVDGQAEACFQAITKDIQFKDGSVKVSYGPDPCDPVNRA